MNTANEPLAEKLELLMEERNVSQSQLARDTRIKQSSISNMVSRINADKRLREPGYKTIITLAKYFDVSADWLLGLSEYRSTSQSKKIAAKTTGLSDNAVSQLSAWKKDGIKQFCLSYDYTSIIEKLINTKDGNRILGALQNYCDCDFSRPHMEEENGELIEINHEIVFKHNVGTRSYIISDVIEQIALNNVINAVKALKEMRQGKGEGK